MKDAQFKELILQALEHEKGGVQVYETALECVINADLRKEWSAYLSQTRHHVDVLTEASAILGFDPNEETPGRKIVHEMGASLVQAMKLAKKTGEPEAAQLVACDCVVLAETKDHANWELIGECAKSMTGKGAEALKKAYDEIEDEEDEHLYHSKGWGRELWLKSLGLASVLPPPEESADVKSAIAAAKAKEKSIAQRKH